MNIQAIPSALREIFSKEKQFKAGSVLKSSLLNRLGLLPARMAGAHLARRLRVELGRSALSEELNDHVSFFRENGYVAISDFMPEPVHAAIQQEVRLIVETGSYDVEQNDGPTSIRRKRISKVSAPACEQVLVDPRTIALIRALSGFVIRRAPLGVEVITQGSGGRDGNKVTHSDTFHPTLKIWYFMHDVTPEHGPLVYYPRSHRLSLRKLRWAYRCGQLASAAPEHHGSFRPSPADMEALRIEQPVHLRVKANTLVIADTHGFHRRGEGAGQISRVALWGSIRPNPFLLIPTQVTRRRLYNP